MTKDHIARREDTHEISESGAFVRQKNRFDTPFGDGQGQLPVEAGRYRLLWAPICPWAHRSVIARELLGLQDVISLGTAKPVRTDAGWDFSEDPNGGILPGSDYKYLPEIYATTDPDYEGRATVPTVVDTQTGKVVNNDYFNLTYYWEEEFKPFHKEGAPDLFPKALQAEIREFNDMLFNEVNNAVYKCGFAQSQEAYEENYDLLFNRLDQLEERLSTQRYLFGDQITDSDIRFYVTLARFDVSYYPEFKANRNRIIDFLNIWNYAKDLYQTPGFGSTTDFTQIKMGYSLGNVGHNPYHILAKGPDTSIWNEPHDRDRFN
ncbi:glutathione S-transferase C-terminal domain-containing protein [Aerococcus sp. UMB7834]|uniref:glutathione S-transferase family protein n=1 Tax=Aerococcus sp. UMB7834 TaxID=3046342 RepID=UPI0025504E1A|nr:glutathione S-transferase C-terminal domain-containing protein [Aerococcus sp. UMB7834]MDK6804697.1 glutathione S-transferase C-terminal domain-containing protein [Aerococcus sp. UMB7834]